MKQSQQTDADDGEQRQRDVAGERQDGGADRHRRQHQQGEGIGQPAGEIEQHGKLHDIEGEEDRGLAVIDAYRGRAPEADREVEQRR